MSLADQIEKMEEALKKKKILRTEKSKAKIVTLNERVTAKKEKIEKLNTEVEALENEVAQLTSDNAVGGTETKTGPFVPTSAGESKDDNKKSPPKK